MVEQQRHGGGGGADVAVELAVEHRAPDANYSPTSFRELKFLSSHLAVEPMTIYRAGFIRRKKAQMPRF